MILIPKWIAGARGAFAAWQPPGGIYRHITLSSLALSVLLLAATGAIAFGTLHWGIREAIESDLDVDGRLVQQRLEHRLNAFARHLSAYAHGSKLVAGLAVSNPGEQSAYLASTLKTYSPPLQQSVALAIFDRQGRVLANNAETSALAALPDVRQVLRDGQPRANIAVDTDGTRLLRLVFPLESAASSTIDGVAGTIHASVRLDEIFFEASGLLSEGIVLRELIADTGAIARNRPGYIQRVWPMKLEAPLDTLGLHMRIGRPDDVVDTAIRQAAVVYGAMGILVLLAAWYAAHRMGRRMTTPITSLNRIASEIASSGSLDLKAEVGGNHELATLAETFNSMMEKLRASHTQLQACKSEFKALLENSPYLIARFDRNLRCIYINRIVQAYFGVPPERVVQRAADDLGIRKSVQELMRRLFTEGGEEVYEYDRPDRNFEAHFVAEYGPGECVASVLCIMRDVSARRAAEESLRLATRAIESSENPIMVTGAAGDGYLIRYVNPAFERVTGYSAQEAIGRNCSFLQGEDRDQPALEQLRNALLQGRETRVVLRNYRKDGSRFWNALSISPVRDAAGKVTHFLGEMTDITAQHEQQEQLEHQATHDALTGLPNRSLLSDRLMQAISYAQRYQRMVAVAFLDLDKFKHINDTMGHDAGDTLLKIVADRLSACVRDSDTVARLGGDEFVLVLYDQANEDITYHAMQRVLNSISQPMEIGGREMTITCSIGFAVYPQDGHDAETLIRNADTAMYRAKELGRDNFQFCTEELHTRINERLGMEAGLRRALERDEFELHYQPRVDLANGKISALEALIRWNHPELGQIEPRRFVPLAEELGLIHHIGEWVLQQAGRQQIAWQQGGVADLPVSVNVSAAQFLHKDFTKTVQRILLETPLDPSRLELEITESLSMLDPDATIRVLRELKEMGVRVTIDDFGTGYSNLNYMKQFPVDIIKLDQSFVQDIVRNPEDLAISNAVISMAHSLRVKVTAEGVESITQLALLADHGCDEMQGYYFSAPLPVEGCTMLLQENRGLKMETLGRRQSSRTLLLIDDEPHVLSALERLLRRTGCRILTANSAIDAFDLMAMHEVGVILSDQRMPEMSGVEFFARIRHMYPATVRMILSGYADIDTVTNAINIGAVYKFLNKPWDANELCRIVNEAFEKYEDDVQRIQRRPERRTVLC